MNITLSYGGRVGDEILVYHKLSTAGNDYLEKDEHQKIPFRMGGTV